MSESDSTETLPQPEPTPQPEPVRRRRRAAWVLALSLAVVIAIIVAAAVLWAPALEPLFSRSHQRPDLAARITQLQAAQTALSRDVASAAAADRAALAGLDARLHALEARPVPPPTDLSGIRQQIAQLTATAGALNTRVDGIDKTLQALPKTDPAEAALALTVLQIGEAVQMARPFAAEYDTLAALVRGHPDLAAAAAPLAGPAKSGVASRAVLAERLHALAGHIATATPPPAANDWRGRIMAQLRSLVTIRRIDGSGQTPAETAVAAAERAMAKNDLAGAVEALQPLSGASAAAAKPWLQLAESRLAVEDALSRLSTLLAAHLGTTATTPSSHG